MIFLDSDCLLQVCLSYISANDATFLIQPIPLYILQINKENIRLTSKFLCLSVYH